MAPWAAVTAAALLIPRVCGTAARFEVAVMNGTMAPAGGGVVVLKRPPMVSVVASQIRGARALQNGGERDVIVTGGNEGTVCVWDAETTTDVYHVVDMWSGGTGRMWLAAVPSGYLITGDGGSQPGEAALFDLTPAQPARLHSWPLRAAVTAITAAVYETPLAATDVVAVGLESGAIEILIPSTEKAVSWERWGMDQHGVDTSRPIESLAARGTAFYLAQDETVFSYTSLIQTNGTKARLFKAGGAVSAMAVSPDGSTLVYAQGFTIRTMGLQADGLVATVGNVRYMGGIVTALAWVADTPDARLAVSDDSGTVILLNQTLHPISFDSADSSSVTLPAVANALASGSGDLLYGVCEDGSLFKFSTTPDATSDDSDSGNNTLAPPTPAPQTASPESQAGVLTEVFGGHITSESGQRAVIQVRLAAALAGTAPTVLTFLTSHDGEGEAIPSTVTYTSASWSQSQNVTVQGVDDDIPDGDVEYEISIHVTDSGDQSYLDLEPTYLTFTNLDNDTLVSTTSQAAASTTSQTTVSSSQSSGAESPSATLAESCAMLDQYGCLTESDRCSWDGKGCVSGEWECSGLSEEVCRFTADKCHVRDGQCRQGAVNSPFRDVLQTDYASHDCNGESSTSVLRLDDCVAYALPDAAGQSMRMVSPCVREGQRVLEVYAEAGCAGAVQTVMLDVGRCVEGVAFECKEPEESEKDSCGALSRYGCSEREECVLEAGGCVLKNSEDEDFVVTPTFPGSETERPLPPTPVPLRRPGGPPSVAPAPPYDGAFFPVGKVAAAGCVVVAAMAAVIALRARRRKQELLVYSRDMTGEKETPPAGAVYGLTSRRSSEQLLVPPPPERRAARMEL
eukprot:TRINITY_DN1479_c0_g1_i3.p1 TRINITY_DN1479_c0_g1~~TRINITY_DN1479_c0_g1_i3.p1  ORF type:complete len:853 (+),score=176.19 TRINITY_DN1479_c0_g1_i3:57-2615(+)